MYKKRNDLDIVITLTDENDCFGSLSKVEELKSFLENDDNINRLKENNMIALYGDWGSGKSSIMNTLMEKLNKEKFDVIWYDTWKYENDYNMPLSLLKFVFYKLNMNVEKSFFKTAQSLLKKFIRDLNISFSGLNFGLSSALKLNEEVNEITTWKDYYAFNEKLNQILKYYNIVTNKRIVVFLDDIDRCEPQNIISLLSATKTVFSEAKDIIFIFGIDKKAVELSLNKKYSYYDEKSQEYLEKIFPISFSVQRKIDLEKMKLYIKEYDLKEITVNFFEKIKMINPRKVKRILNKYSMIIESIGEKMPNIDFSRDFWSLITIYLIILHEFYEEEFDKVLNSWKWQDFYNRISFVLYNHAGTQYHLNYSSDYIKQMLLPSTGLDVFVVIELLSAFPNKSVEMDAIEISGRYTPSRRTPNIIKIGYRDWIASFENNICTKFLNFINNQLDFSYPTILEKTMTEEKKDQYVIKSDIESIAVVLDILL